MRNITCRKHPLFRKQTPSDPQVAPLSRSGRGAGGEGRYPLDRPSPQSCSAGLQATGGGPSPQSLSSVKSVKSVVTNIALPPAHIIDDLVLAALEEDGAQDDITTRAVVNADQWGRGVFIAKDAGVVSGLPVAAAAMSAFTDEISFDTLVEDGERVSAGTELAEVEGPLAAILATERVALNFLQRLSGVATLTRQFCDSVVGTRARILDTRKTTPGLRDLERYAVRCGGGHNHRFNLSSGVLIKDNHIAAAAGRGIDDLADVIALARNNSPHTMRIEIEVTTLPQLTEALQGGADIILLDNMNVEQIVEAIAAVNARHAQDAPGRPLIEASGGVTMETVRQIAEAGVDYISIGALTHSAPALDISLEVASA